MKIVELKFEYSKDAEIQNYWVLKVDDGREFILYEEEFFACYEEMLLIDKKLVQETLSTMTGKTKDEKEEQAYLKKYIESIDFILEH